MASARITYTYPTGESFDFEAEDESPAYPDTLSELVSEVLRMYRETVLA